MTRFDALRPAGLLAFHSLMAAGSIAMLAWILYGAGWVTVDEFQGGIGVALLLLAGGIISAVIVAAVGFLMRDEDRP